MKRKQVSTRLKADLMLLVVVMGWGFSFLMTDISIEALGVFTIASLRLLLAFIVAAAFSIRQLRAVSRETARYCLLLGVLLAAIFTCVTFGVKYTTLANSSFLCGLTVVFVPLLSSLLYRRLPDGKMVFVVVLCLIGIALLTLTDDFRVDRENLLGDILCILCALAYAVHLMVTEKAVKSPNVNAYQLGVLQLGVAGAWCFAVALSAESVRLPPTPKIWGAIVFLAVVCTGLAFIVQSIAQKYTTATHVGVINSLETVFAGIVAYVFGNDTLTLKTGTGAVCIVVALFIMEINLKKLFFLWNKKRV